nr:glycoside hydrolase family 127 protein [Candidatus Neomarinimicrobiota bacterium]
ADSVYINLYISSNADIIVNQKKIEIIQQTDYPWHGKINITVNPEKKTTFTLKLRVPGWARNEVVPGDLYKYIAENPEKVSLLVNGKDENGVLDKGYIEITRKWTRGDKIELTLPLAVRKVIAHEKVADDVNKIAFECGPIVYCAEEIDNHRISEITVPLDTKLNITKGAVLTENVNILRGKVDNQELILIPYYVWSNRGVGKMKVWLPINKE